MSSLQDVGSEVQIAYSIEHVSANNAEILFHSPDRVVVLK